ncbi:hypothetical protein [Limosilactobacillus reuteri]|uniref:hypothetical protein n=1 Tax=Limosilactobacillus reuteri TaxID=1598 RepID=UPI001E56FCD4|nr:hypothetical protein [Limosilactobacillus reuteri]MCC4466119.1 hypothetical protein [Limosilactobacillus reuteri]MCC4472343.1 hypothetical protein [Limosilactobacillus reuteri]MDC6076711.1 hypothetical protein [Limosilactobacillus reuteri]
MSAEVKVLSTSTRTNLEALKHHMKKLGFKYFEEKDGWIDFGTSLYGARLSNTNKVSVHFNNRNMFSMFDNLDLYDKLPEVKQAILDFYEAEGIKE